MHEFHWIPTENGFSRKSKPRIQKVHFGDGYEQRSPDGLNNHLKNYPVTFEGDSDDIYEIEHFLEMHLGYLPFIFTPVGEWVPRTVVCEEWDIKEGSTESVLTTSFREVIA
ncbi:phage tail protein [Photobacterium sp. 1_MG-2023]|uniref:phage tail protein n=1 Tax=Photobacterium sp. 1_MG-2023 TaxID=3062646 RepID=UPI0026E3BE07|nr:phage tail protein [Photobacterium sp. 1_MG-2023]MDO6706794.1 phage tail protein [Photobacterium sp. 1_MG-2023]